MNSLRRRIDRFCVLHPNFGIPNLMLIIVIGARADDEVYQIAQKRTDKITFK